MQVAEGGGGPGWWGEILVLLYLIELFEGTWDFARIGRI
jgi:hypothetical protein